VLLECWLHLVVSQQLFPATKCDQGELQELEEEEGLALNTDDDYIALRIERDGLLADARKYDRNKRPLSPTHSSPPTPKRIKMEPGQPEPQSDDSGRFFDDRIEQITQAMHGLATMQRSEVS